MKPSRLLGRPKTMALAMILLVGAAGFGVARASQTLFPANAHASLKLADPNEGPSKTGFAPVVKSVLPDVVNISTSKITHTSETNPDEQIPPFFQQFFGQQFGQQFEGPNSEKRAPRHHDQREESLGSGVM